MKTKSIEEITKELQDKRDAVNAEVEDLELKIEMQDAAIKEHQTKMGEASDAGNVGDYVAEKKDMQAAKDVREMYKTRLDKLTMAPLISEDEYNKTIHEIKNAMGDKVLEVQKDTDNVLKGLTPCYDELREDVSKTNNAMKIAFCMCYPGDKPKKKDGAFATPETYRGHFDLMSRIKRALGRENERDF